MINYFFQGITLGTAAGITCFIFCLPVFLGSSLNGKNSIVTNFLSFTAGRFIAYITAGIIASLAGKELLQRPLFGSFAKIATGILLLYWGLKEFTKNNDQKENKLCPVKNKRFLNPFTAGILTGISPCPPFLAGIALAMSSGSIGSGITFFSGFFISTTILLTPFFTVGLLNHRQELKIISQFISIISGSLFLIYGIIKFF